MVIAVIAALALQQPVDSAYTANIRELTTEPRFNTELTDHLPADPRVPTPFKVLGYVPGTVGRLSTSPTSHATSARSTRRRPA